MAEKDFDERRKYPRYPASLNVSFAFSAAGKQGPEDRRISGKGKNISGKTGDISFEGLLIKSNPLHADVSSLFLEPQTESLESPGKPNQGSPSAASVTYKMEEGGRAPANFRQKASTRSGSAPVTRTHPRPSGRCLGGDHSPRIPPASGTPAPPRYRQRAAFPGGPSGEG